MNATLWRPELLTGEPSEAGLLRNFVDGAFVSSESTFAKLSPVTGQKIFDVCEADAATVDAAVTAARAALKGPWGRMSEQERSVILRRVADELERRFDDLVAAEVGDTGKSISQARTLDIPRGAANFRAFADFATTASTESYTTTLADGRRALNYAVRKPVGVVAIIVPWNLPLLLLTWKVAPALACGNTVVVKPSEETPSSATVLAEVMADAGVPAGVFNLVHGFGPSSAGEFLTKHPGVDAITFTGESATGSAIAKAAADGVKATSFELGGKNAGLIFADADLDAAVEGSVRSVFTNGGQVCLCTERLYVERPVYEEFCSRLAARASELTFGWPSDEATVNMPLISQQHREKVLGYYELARSEGAKFHAGGGVPTFGDARDNGCYVQPTVVTGLPADARTNTEEIFGPICHIAPFDTEEEAFVLANNSKYGLAATVWTRDVGRAHRAGAALEVGIVWVNTWFLRDLRTPFGGVKLSGIGREGGNHSLHFYSELTNVCVEL
ncbi:aminomuconate-semialdehyde/2-hydroxymuconate-6-semialdehyde dehydrogenase [Kribbella orskensis]|uniref:Aminomuconate-semialdehyde/2-hydroxymuconate-6-semialdehyde dehydrogenase n=1 Tax=Kribbella orskensis TaxID=2512216 RepID=A0ABY2BCM3_9ACTN|nr:MULTISPECIES: 2-hydroxymuconic semialdehyde dehydrogenase [Kribbella]TCN34829.1 aminomuconate-semialdehyde/2-hydroxymuconate-6-semialdehyde dehydrogenase [Kribbella sp. VKM Ac-2500]TCO15534.1 aminomuconate-semialdehyde/2-hydroxymuconate-6-semialdehyde dehydrogenase [Kribbella orskensis]